MNLKNKKLWVPATVTLAVSVTVALFFLNTSSKQAKSEKPTPIANYTVKQITSQSTIPPLQKTPNEAGYSRLNSNNLASNKELSEDIIANNLKDIVVNSFPDIAEEFAVSIDKVHRFESNCSESEISFANIRTEYGTIGYGVIRKFNSGSQDALTYYRGSEEDQKIASSPQTFVYEFSEVSVGRTGVLSPSNIQRHFLDNFGVAPQNIVSQLVCAQNKADKTDQKFSNGVPFYEIVLPNGDKYFVHAFDTSFDDLSQSEPLIEFATADWSNNKGASPEWDVRLETDLERLGEYVYSNDENIVHEAVQKISAIWSSTNSFDGNEEAIYLMLHDALSRYNSNMHIRSIVCESSFKERDGIAELCEH